MGRQVRLSYCPWRSPLRPYKVISRGIYRLESVSVPVEYGSSRMREAFQWRINPEVHLWLRGRAPSKFLGIPTSSVIFYSQSGLMPFSMMAREGKLEIGRDPPAIWLARKGDAYLLKMLWE